MTSLCYSVTLYNLGVADICRSAGVFWVSTSPRVEVATFPSIVLNPAGKNLEITNSVKDRRKLTES